MLLCLHLVCLVNQICVAEAYGGGFSASVMNFGVSGEKNSGDFARETEMECTTKKLQCS